MKKHILAIIIATIFLTACSITQTATITALTAKTSILSVEVEKYSTQYQEFSANQDAFTDLESLQSDFRGALAGSITLLDAAGFYTRAVGIYEILYAEVMERQSEFTAAQLVELRVLNDSLLSLDSDFKAFIADDSNSEFLDNSQMVMNLMTITSGVIKLAAL